ncbi:MAG: hypothetical protein LUD72_05220 [Bacteroidales bacterium]|nr:hypothetical protein [Bacteroidales bacterium]
MKYTDVTKNMCPVCGRPHEPGKMFCRDCVRAGRHLTSVAASAEGMLLASDEICRRCRHSFAESGGLCADCRADIKRRRATNYDEGASAKPNAPPAEGEERYRSILPEEDLSNYVPMSVDTKENILRCLSCEIPVKYCTGGKCVKAYRRWQADMASYCTRRKAAENYRKRTKRK